MTRFTWPALLLVAFLLAGCSLGSSATKAPPQKTLSRAQFKHLVVRATKRLVCSGLQHEKPTSLQQVRAGLKKDVRAYERWLFTLRGLAPPASAAVAFHRMLGALDRLDLVFHQMVDALDAQDLPRMKALLKRMHRLIARFNTRFHVQHHGHLVCPKK